MANLDAMYAINVKNVKKRFYCKICDYRCSHKSELERHFERKKHKKNQEKYKKSRKKSRSVEYVCKYCGSGYKHQPSLSRHIKK